MSFLSNRVAPGNPNLKVYSHSLGSSGLAWYAPQSLWAQARNGFPQSLNGMPVSLPTRHAAVRGTNRPVVRPSFRPGPGVVGEFEYSALITSLRRGGMGVFPMAELIDDKLSARYDVRRVGPCEGVEEHFFALGTEKKILHPLVQRLLPAKP